MSRYIGNVIVTVHFRVLVGTEMLVHYMYVSKRLIHVAAVFGPFYMLRLMSVLTSSLN